MGDGHLARHAGLLVTEDEVRMGMNAGYWILVGWLAVVGSAIGSFLNVVVYRLPLGISIVHPPSRCPKCNHLIRWFDNVPVLGWIMLGGRCRDCGNPISCRYPLVEATTAVIFGLLAAFEFLGEGTNLPLRQFVVAPEISVTGLNAQELYGVFLCHLLLMCTLLCTALIEIDGQRLPRSLFAPALLVGVAAPLVWPMIRPVPAFVGEPQAFAGAIDGAVGLAVGAGVGGLFSWASRRQKTSGMLFGLPIVGLFLGWQAALVLAVATAAICISYLANWIFRSAITRAWILPPSVWLLLLTLVWILAWGRFVAMLGTAWG
jgi:leader peptidase (prepilin peptidase)/N-methyltransferase